jgi:drug/metabolite transporter (DMT)-like permease
MNQPLENQTLDTKAIIILTALCLAWGFNGAVMKVGNMGVDPIFGAAIRSLIAALCLSVWMKIRHIPLFPGSLFDGMMVGLLFGVEFALLFSSLLYTTVASAWILLYSTPFFHTLGAHFFLEGDRITKHKAVGLITAFCGIVLLLSKYVVVPSLVELMGDLAAMGAALFWAMTTIYIKKRLVGKVSHHHTLFYQTLFSIPILFILSVLFKETTIHHVDLLIIGSFLFQGIIIAFISYLIWFYLVHAYPVSRLSSFTFLTPVFATISGMICFHDPLTIRLILSLILVSIGIYVVNRK